ncbi:MAG: IclR family transcriptional regulator [Rubrivivax sp.]|jgi:DNA-binding IclR family transcriptional regulator|nr:IclR family transcriptional regulator [Rubrivivax sp.]
MPRSPTPAATTPPAAAAAATESIALRAVSVLEQVARARTPVTLDSVTQATALPKPTAHRILAMLVDAGLLHRDAASKRYTVGTRLAALGLDLWQHETLRTPWRQALEFAVASTGESCNLTVLDHGRVLYLDRVETDRPLRLHLQPGTRVPLHCTASGKLFLAAMDEAEFDAWLDAHPLERHTAHTITDRARLRREVETVRRTRVGLHDSELFEDSVAIAVPVTDARGRTCAAVAMHAPSARESIPTCQRHLPALREAASRVGATLGGGTLLPTTS